MNYRVHRGFCLFNLNLGCFVDIPQQHHVDKIFKTWFGLVKTSELLFHIIIIIIILVDHCGELGETWALYSMGYLYVPFLVIHVSF